MTLDRWTLVLEPVLMSVLFALDIILTLLLIGFLKSLIRGTRRLFDAMPRVFSSKP